MIDTINLTVHDLEKHAELRDYLHKANHRQGLTKFTKVLSSEDELSASQKVRLQNKTRFHESGQEIETMYWNKLPSYNYDVAYQLNFNADCIKFNISIPKYQYGTNVFMLLPPHYNEAYTKRLKMNTKELLYKSYDDLRKFVNRFFTENFNDIYVDFLDVQLSQIHLCFNYVMRSKEDALMTIEHLKRTKKKYYREGKGGKGGYDTGIYFPAKAFTFKIYHKGAEFRKHDKKQLEKKRDAKNKPLGGIQEVEELADRTVRYELEIRNRGMNELMKSKVFRKDDQFYQTAKKNFYKYRQGRLFKTKEGKKDYSELKPKTKRRIKFVEFVENKTFKFFMEGNDKWTRNSDMDRGLIDNRFEDSFYNELDQPYSYALHKAASNKFLEMIEHFKPNIICDVYYILKGFKADKERDKEIIEFSGTGATETEGLSEEKLKTILELLEKYTFEEMEKMGLIKYRTLRRYLKYLEKFGITKNATIGNEIDIMPNNILNYDDYIRDNFVMMKHFLYLHINY